VINAGDVKQAPDGSIGPPSMSFPERVALERRRNHDFLAVERAAAKGWRADLAEHDPARLIEVIKHTLPAEAKRSRAVQGAHRFLLRAR
jgi:hypothetical protein